MITIHNLNIDLGFIYKFIGKELAGYQGVADKLKGLQQFYTLMLNGNLIDVCDEKKRVVSCSNIDLGMLAVVLDRYNRVNCPGLKDLKKREV